MIQGEHPLSIFSFCPRCGSPRFIVNNFKSKKCEDCGFVFYFNLYAAVAVFVSDTAGRLLIARRGKDPAKGTLDLPGGFVDSFESGEEAVAREIREETGLAAGQAEYLFSMPNIYPYSGFTEHTLDLFYRCCVDDFDSAVPADDVSELIVLEPSGLDPNDFGLNSIRKAVGIYKEKYR